MKVNNLKNGNLSIVGNNSAGLTGKLDSLKRLIAVFRPGVVMLQETKVKKPGKVKLKEFVIFEKIRENNQGGGLMIIVHENMSSFLMTILSFGKLTLLVSLDLLGPLIAMVHRKISTWKQELNSLLS